MPDLSEQLRQCLEGRVCFLGLGNVDYGDDGIGVRLAEALDRSRDSLRRAPAISNTYSVLIAGTAPEGFIGRLADEGFDHVIFLDAVDFGGSPGAVALLRSEEIVARFPQISTHKLSLGLLAKWIEMNGRTKVWLLGVQPESLRPGKHLTACLEIPLDCRRRREESQITCGFATDQRLLTSSPTIVKHALSPAVRATMELLLELLTEGERRDLSAEVMA